MDPYFGPMLSQWLERRLARKTDSHFSTDALTAVLRAPRYPADGGKADAKVPKPGA